ncbi:MAG: AAA family ATPase [Myxococcota bacterium]
MAESSIVGRQREIERLAAAIEDAGKGAGSLIFITGEPGIGKSRLSEEAARIARDQGIRTFWGRCWEAGGAPAYWPWVQVLRAIVRTAEPGELDAFLPQLAQLLPELQSSHGSAGAADLGPEQARFQLMDAVGHALGDVSAKCPILVILEDLHVADVSTVLLLEFLAASVRNQAVLIVGTFREAEAARAASGAQLLRTAQQAQRIPLDRLLTADVATFLEHTGSDADPQLAEDLFRVTEGHPLFLVEVGRLWRSRDAARTNHEPEIPRSVRQAIHERLDALSAECRLVLQRGSLLGREFDTTLLEASHPEDGTDYEQACREAHEQTILLEVAPQRYRFSHFLIRELVHESIGESERRTAHRRVAETLRDRPNKDRQPPWSEVAHHFSAAGPEAVTHAADAYRQASTQALHQLAFDEAVEAASQALVAIERADPVDEPKRIGILIDLARSQTRAGAIRLGKGTAERAAAAAKALGSPPLFAEAALEHGTALIFAHVDQDLIRLLEEALDLLEDSDSAPRARVMARLAAALQPSLDPRHAIALARDSIDMARRVGDKNALLDTLRTGGSAMVDMSNLEERLVLDREHAALAEELNSPSESLRANVRSFMDFVQLGRLDDAYRTLHACERVANDLRHPAYRWRCQALHGLRALWEGDFDTAEGHIEQVRILGESSKDPNAQCTYEYQRMRWLQLRGDFEGHRALVDGVERWWRGTDFGNLTADVIAGSEHLLGGRKRAALERFSAKGVEQLVQTGDSSIALCVARLCEAARDQALAKRILRRVSGSKDHLVTTGMIGATIDGPGSWAMALLCRCLDRTEDAKSHYEQALVTARRAGGRPVAAWIACELAELLATSEDASERARAIELGRLASERASELGMAWLEERASQLETPSDGAGGAIPSSESPSRRFTIDRVGDAWRISHDSKEFHLKDMKGIRLLAELVGNPGREYHVLDLGDGAKAPIDRGDAGEVLDEEARRQYQSRVATLREELEEAESWNDAGRAERAREELAFLERELSQALGLGGRQRRTGSAAERARVNVQRRIRDAIRRVEAHDPKLAKHLDQAIRTGTFCSYDP